MPFDTLFKPTGTGGGGQSSGDFVKDSFADISLPADNNIGLISNSLTNPLSYFFNNDDLPKYGSKTLFVKDIVLIEDRSKWINNKPTYEIIWHETFSGVRGYVAGNVRKINNTQGNAVFFVDANDIFGVTGVIRNVFFFTNPSQASTASASIYIDGVDTTNDLNFNSVGNPNTGFTKYAGGTASTSLQTNNIHDYQLRSNEANTMEIAGVVAYFENASDNIQCFSGTTYVNKDKKTTSNGVANAVPGLTGILGGKIAINKNNSGAYVLTSRQVPYLTTIATGSSGTNTLNVTTGQGSSFPAGSLIGLVTGSSFFRSNVLSVSTDTLTLGITLPFGVSGTIQKLLQAGFTVPISASFHTLNKSLVPAFQNNLNTPVGFFNQLTQDGSFTSNDFSYRLWSDQTQLGAVQGVRNLTFNGATTGFFAIESRATALDVEIIGQGILHGTFSINGIAFFGINEGFTGLIKRTVFTDAGNSYKTVRFDVGSSFTLGEVGFAKINLYEYSNPGSTLGRLAEFNVIDTYQPQAAINASLIAFGTAQRIYADSFYAKNDWTFGYDIAGPGGAFVRGSTNSQTISVGYYGKECGFLGTAGTSFTISIDGTAVGSTLNVLQSVATLGFHQAVFTCHTGTHTIYAFDFVGSKGEIKSLQKYSALPTLDCAPKIYTQSETPSSAADGSLWIADPVNNEIWVSFLGVWYQLNVVNKTDNINYGDINGLYGYSGGDDN